MKRQFKIKDIFIYMTIVLLLATSCSALNTPLQTGLRSTSGEPSVQFVPPTPPNGRQNVPDLSIPVALSSQDDQLHYSFVDFNDDVLLWMRMDDVSSTATGATVYDISSHGHHGNALGEAMQTTDGMFAKGFVFDGVEDSILTDVPLLSDDTFSFGGWMKWYTIAPDHTPWDVQLQQADQYDNGYEIYGWEGDTENGPMVYAYHGFGYGRRGEWIEPAGHPITTDVWYHVMLTCNETHLALYVNGSFWDAIEDVDDPVPQRPFAIGGGQPQRLYWFDGVVDEVIVVDRTLSEPEIAALYNASASSHTTTFIGTPGNNTFTGFACDTDGNMNQTETRWREIVNVEPLAPLEPSGPSTGVVGNSFEFTTNSTDPEGLLIRYGWDFTEDFVVDRWTAFQNSGEDSTISYSWDSVGEYQVQVICEDEYEATSNWSDPHQITITNTAPEQPSTPEGPSEGLVDETYTFTTSAVDPDGHNLRYGWDFNGDQQVDKWTGFVASGTQVSMAYLWTTRGFYNVSVMAEDEYGLPGPWSEPLSVHIGGVALSIGEISGGFLRVKAEITNTGDADASDVLWRLVLSSGWILTGDASDGSIDSLTAGDENIVQSDPIIGFGKTDIRVSAFLEGTEVPISKEVSALVLLFFIIILE